MKENFQFLTVLTLNLLFTSENLPLLTFWVTFPISMTCVKFHLNRWQNINEELQS